MLYSAMLTAAAAASSLLAPTGDLAGQQAEMLQVSATVPEAAATLAPTSEASDRSKTRYCVKRQLTGSRMPIRKCLTREEWIAKEGFDPLAPKE